MARAIGHLAPLLVSLAFLSAVHAQQVFRTGTDLVLLSVTANEGPLAAKQLDRPDFRVFEDGVEQEISVFARDAQPIALSLLIDTSASMEPKIGVAREAAIGFCRRLGPDDIAQIVSFNSDTEILQPFTSDLGLLERAILRTRPTGSTAMHTAVYIALNELQARPVPVGGRVRRQALILLSDGEDTTSLLRYDDVLERAKRTDVTIYAIGIRSRTETAAGFREYDYALRTMTQTTGGRVFFVDNPATLPAIYNQIADELANQYTIGYTSRNLRRDGAWRLISVRVSRPGVIARTRTGYYASATKGQ